MWSIYKKEFFGILKSPTFALLAAICTFIWGLTFCLYLYQYVGDSLLSDTVNKKYNFHNQIVSDYLELIHIFGLIIVGAFSMRVFTEEKKNKTLTWLLTMPVNLVDVLLGKYLAVFSLVLILLGVGISFPMSVSYFGEFQWGAFGASLLGLVLLFSVYVAISIVASLLTDSIVLAMILSFAFNIFILVFGSTADLLDDGVVKRILNFNSLGLRFNEFKLGVVNTESIFYFLSITFLGLFCSFQLLQSERSVK